MIDFLIILWALSIACCLGIQVYDGKGQQDSKRIKLATYLVAPVFVAYALGYVIAVITDNSLKGCRHDK